MSAFKSSNRFSFLDENENENKSESIKPPEREREYFDKPNYKSYNDSHRQSYNQFKNYNNEPVVVIKKDFEIKEEEFPDLASPVNKNTTSFASLLKKEKEKEKEQEQDIIIEKIIVPPGWSYYKYIKCDLFGRNKTEESEINKFKASKCVEKIEPIIQQKILLNEAEKIIKRLSLLHDKRTNEYKESWGEDEWERMFICPNYDYEYFDKLDEEYEKEQAKIYEQYYYNDSEDYDNY